MVNARIGMVTCSQALLAEKLVSGLVRNSVRIIHATLRAMLNAPVDDGVILSNPAGRLGRQLRLVQRAGERQEAIKAFTREQLAHLPSLRPSGP
jgi:hypothetical protein